ncbi:beta strand repeat-containing protein [Methanobrevibacter cuticularis]|nr:carboxypeptidase-like regulatory domain-containing protein [Methanobrevibacter cuticularis]
MSSVNATVVYANTTTALDYQVEQVLDPGYSANNTIYLANGTYSQWQRHFNIGINKSVTFIGSGNTRIQGNGNDWLFNVKSGYTVSFINMTFINGNGTSFNFGGAINNNGGTLTVENCKFYNNAGREGGAIRSDSSSTVNIINSEFINNTGLRGGAIYLVNGGLNIENSTFINNSASQVGGAVWNGGINASITNSSFINNTATDNGGGIFNSGNMSVSRNTMEGNTANAFGNGIYNTGNMGILNLTYIGNSTIHNIIGSNIILYANLTDDMGNPITGQEITFYVNGIYSGNVAIIEGYANLTYISSVGGDLIVTGDYTGHDGYDITVLNGSLNRFITNSTVVVSNGSKVGINTFISGVVFDENGKPVVSAQLSVGVDGEIYNVTTDSNGVWNLNYRPIHNGTFVVSVSWVGNDTYYGFVNGTSFNVSKFIVNSTVVVSSGSKVGINASVSGVVFDEDGKPVVSAQLSVGVVGEIYNVTTDLNGAWNLNYAPTHNGTFVVSVSWVGNDTYYDFVNSTSFNVSKIITNSTVVVFNGSKVGINASVSGVVFDENGKPVVSAQLSVGVVGEIYNVTTDLNGVWNLAYRPIHNGTFVVSVSWVGNDTYYGFVNSTSFNVSKIITNSTVVVSSGSKVGINTFISGVVFDEDGKPVVSAQLSVGVGGDIYNVTTDLNGAWNLAYRPIHNGTFVVSVSWVGNDTYYGFVNGTSFNVSKLVVNSTIVNPKIIKLGKAINITGVLTDEKGNIVANTPINIIISGNSYNLTTDSGGAWNLNYKPNIIGKVNIIVNYSGTDKYTDFTTTSYFEVEKDVIKKNKISLSAPKINQGTKTNIKITLKGFNGNSLVNKKVSLTINKKTYTKTTNRKGIAIFNIANLKGGKYTVQAVFNDSKGSHVSVSKIQIVKPKVDLSIVSIKKSKTSNRQVFNYEVVIQNKGSLKSKITNLHLWHVRNAFKTKIKNVKVKSLKAGEKTTLIISYYPDSQLHKYCKTYLSLNPKKTMDEITYKNNLKIVKL